MEASIYGTPKNALFLQSQKHWRSFSKQKDPLNSLHVFGKLLENARGLQLITAAGQRCSAILPQSELRFVTGNSLVPNTSSCEQGTRRHSPALEGIQVRRVDDAFEQEFRGQYCTIGTGWTDLLVDDYG
jgi:hypothetical protein